MSDVDAKKLADVVSGIACQLQYMHNTPFGAKEIAPLNEAASQLKAMQSRLESMEKDAARWRFARDNFDMQSDDYLWIETDNGQRIHVQSWARSENERACDTAMQANKGE